MTTRATALGVARATSSRATLTATSAPSTRTARPAAGRASTKPASATMGCNLPTWLRRRWLVDESGMATAEFAVALPAVVVVVSLVVALTQLLLTHHRTWNAASVAARSAARGDGDDAIRRAVAATGVPATLSVARDGGWVTVSLVARPPSPLGWVLPDVTARAVAAQEEGP